jgi:hypothetical protein
VILDAINGIFEILGAVIISLNIRRIRKDKEVRGFDWRVMGFFTLWGYWNLIYYPALGQIFSLVAGIGVVVMNSIYLFLILYYLRKQTD